MLFQRITGINVIDGKSRGTSSFEAVLFDDDRARLDYLFSQPHASEEEGEHAYGVGDGSGKAIVDLRPDHGSPFELTQRSFVWDPGSPTVMTEVPFQWEGTGVHYMPAIGPAFGIAATQTRVFIAVPSDGSGTELSALEVYDRATMLPLEGIRVGRGPRAIAAAYP